MTGFPDGPLADALHQMAGTDLVCYCPCAGRDIELALTWLGSHFGYFVFCDKSYRRPDMTGRGAVPKDWQLAHRVPDGPRPPVPSTNPKGTGEVMEIWQRPDRSTVTLEFWAARAEELLTNRFAPETVSALLHINDGTGEGGSNLWFLGSPGICRAEVSRCLLPMVSERLTHEALVITDSMLADPEFARRAPFSRYGRRWEPLVSLENNRGPDRHVTVWQTRREGE